MRRRSSYVRNPQPRVHPLVVGPDRDFRGRIVCDRCGSTEDASVHAPLPARDEHEKAVEARKVGERGDQAD
jgi:hypothetical protein